MGLQGRPNAGGTIARAVVAVVRRADQAEISMTEADQVLGHLACCGLAVKSDAWMLAAAIDSPGQHVGPLEFVEQHEQLGVMVGADEHEGVDASLDQRLGEAQFRLQIVVVGGENQRIAARLDLAFECAGCS